MQRTAAPPPQNTPNGHTPTPDPHAWRQERTRREVENLILIAREKERSGFPRRYACREAVQTASAALVEQVGTDQLINRLTSALIASATGVSA
jgi:hypothetical protein